MPVREPAFEGSHAVLQRNRGIDVVELIEADLVHAERAEADLTVPAQGVRPPVDWEAVADTPVTALFRVR